MLGHLNHIEEEAIKKLKTQLGKNLGSNLKSVFIYGSKARGDYNDDSDIDILVIVDDATPQIKDIIRDIVLDIQLDYSLPISIHIRSFDYFNTQRKNKLNVFIHNLEREGILI